MFKMPFKSSPYQKCVESDLSEEEIDKSETGKPQILEEPRDSYYIVYLTFFIIGITSLLPPYFFTIPNEYWMYKFRDPKSETRKLNSVQVSYTAYAGLATSIPLPICGIVNIFINEKISCQKRIIGSLIIMLILFFITLVFVKIDTSLWQDGFLIVTLSTILILSAASGILLSTMGGVINKFSSKYITSFFLGQGVSGAFSSFAEVVSVAIGASPTQNGLIYYIIGCLTIFISLVAYLILPKNLYYKHFMFENNKNETDEFENDLADHPKINYKLIFKKIWQYVLSISMVLTVTLSLQPGVTVLTKSYGSGIWSDYYFVPVITFLLPNVADCFGRLSSIFFDWPKNGYVLIFLNVIRMGVIPFIVFCNLQPRGNLPVIFNSDAYYIVFQAIGGFSNGYLLNIAVINIPKVVDHHEKYSAGLFVQFFFGLAINIGSLLSMLLVKII